MTTTLQDTGRTQLIIHQALCRRKKALDGWECWMFRWTATDLKEKNQSRIEKKRTETRS